MKKFSFFALLAVAAFAVGCSEDVDNGGSSMERKLIDVSFGVDIASEDSRSEVDLVDGKVQGNWELDTDKIGVFSAVDQNMEFTYGDNKLFNGQLTEAAEYTLQAYYPYNADFVDGISVMSLFGYNRTQDGGKFNSAYDILLSEPKTTSELDGHTFDFVRPLSVLNFDTSAAGAFRYARLVDLDGSMLSSLVIGFNMSEGLTAEGAIQSMGMSEAPAIMVDLGSNAAHSDVFFNIFPGNYNLQLDLITEDYKMASIYVDRTNVEKPFEAGKFYYKKVSGVTFAGTDLAAPSIVWPDEDMNEVHAITNPLTYQAALNISAPAGIESITVGVSSSYLDMMLPDVAPSYALTGKLSIVPADDLGGLVTGGANYYGESSAVFDITEFLPIIMQGEAAAYGDHVFTIYVTDKYGRSASQSLTFNYAEPEPEPEPIKATASVGSVDLWTNTASVSVVANQEVGDVKVFVKDSDETTYNEIDVTSIDKINWTAAVEPTWLSTTNGEGNTVYYLDGKTGIFAGNKYDYYVKVYDSESNLAYTSDVATYTADAGDAFPEGDLVSTDWESSGFFNGEVTTSGIISKTYTYTYDFWGSGYNNYAKTLCTFATFDDEGCAKLQSGQAIGIPTPGNMFTGDFTYKGTAGTVNFGKKVTYGARPRAVNVWAKAEVYDIVTRMYADNYESDTGKVAPAVGESDRARIYVCLTDWSATHGVKSGASVTPAGAWNPEGGKRGNLKAGTQAISAGDIVSYALVDIDKNHAAVSSTGLIKIEMPLYYYDTTAANDKAALNAANYNIVVSAATSYLGDYMISSSGSGGKNNVLYIDKFEWVY